MSFSIDINTTVRDVVVKHPGTRKVLESSGIDYCCGGGKTLTVAAAEAGVALQDVVEAMRQAASNPATPEPRGEGSWLDASLTELVEHIESTHHVFMKKSLPRVGDLFIKVLRAHGENHGEMLRPLQKTFAGLRAELEPHLMKEEKILFPYIRQMDASVAATGAVPPMHCGTVKNPIGQMEAEHENAGAALARMRAVTSDYALPGDACPTFTALFETLQEMEADLHEHIHLENNILFPRTVDMANGGG